MDLGLVKVSWTWRITDKNVIRMVGTDSKGTLRTCERMQKKLYGTYMQRNKIATETIHERRDKEAKRTQKIGLDAYILLRTFMNGKALLKL